MVALSTRTMVQVTLAAVVSVPMSQLALELHNWLLGFTFVFRIMCEYNRFLEGAVTFMEIFMDTLHLACLITHCAFARYPTEDWHVRIFYALMVAPSTWFILSVSVDNLQGGSSKSQEGSVLYTQVSKSPLCVSEADSWPLSQPSQQQASWKIENNNPQVVTNLYDFGSLSSNASLRYEDRNTGPRNQQHGQLGDKDAPRSARPLPLLGGVSDEACPDKNVTDSGRFSWSENTDEPSSSGKKSVPSSAAVASMPYGLLSSGDAIGVTKSSHQETTIHAPLPPPTIPPPASGVPLSSSENASVGDKSIHHKDHHSYHNRNYQQVPPPCPTLCPPASGETKELEIYEQIVREEVVSKGSQDPVAIDQRIKESGEVQPVPVPEASNSKERKDPVGLDEWIRQSVDVQRPPVPGPAGLDEGIRQSVEPQHPVAVAETSHGVGSVAEVKCREGELRSSQQDEQKEKRGASAGSKESTCSQQSEQTGRRSSTSSQSEQMGRRSSSAKRHSLGQIISNNVMAALPGTSELRFSVVERLSELFNKMDDDGNRSITKEEAMKFWGSNFGKINANAMFNEVDDDGNGYVTWEEFLQFWVNVKKSGYSQEDILEEVESMLEGGSWVDWNDGRNTEKPGGTKRKSSVFSESLSEFSQKIKDKVESLSTGSSPTNMSQCLPFGGGELRPKTKDKLKQFFQKMDADDSGSVTKEEAMSFWGKNFAKVNAAAMFNEVDEDGNGEVTWDEFLEFWQQVKRSGYSDKQILQEVDSMLEGNSWVDWNDGRSTDNATFADRTSSKGSTKSRRSSLNDLKSKVSSVFSRGELNRLTKERLKAMFEVLDLDGSGDISKEEAEKFWGNGFAKVNAMAMFNEVDADGSGNITYDEFMDFWKQVKRSGYSDKDILNEVDSMMEGGSWVDWNDFRSTEGGFSKNY